MKKLFIGGLIVLSVVSFAFCGKTTQTNNSTDNSTQVTEEKQVAQSEAELTPEEKIEKLSKKICGKENYREYTYLPSTDSSTCDSHIAIESDLHDNLTNEYINLDECDNAFELAKAIFTDDTFKDINEFRYYVWAKFVDKYGNEEEQVAIKIFITRDTFNKFNLESDNADLLYQSLPDTADYYSTRIK